MVKNKESFFMRRATQNRFQAGKGINETHNSQVLCTGQLFLRRKREDRSSKKTTQRPASSEKKCNCLSHKHCMLSKIVPIVFLKILYSAYIILNRSATGYIHTHTDKYQCTCIRRVMIKYAGKKKVLLTFYLCFLIHLL